MEHHSPWGKRDQLTTDVAVESVIVKPHQTCFLVGRKLSYGGFPIGSMDSKCGILPHFFSGQGGGVQSPMASGMSVNNTNGQSRI